MGERGDIAKRSTFRGASHGDSDGGRRKEGDRKVMGDRLKGGGCMRLCGRYAGMLNSAHPYGAYYLYRKY